MEKEKTGRYLKWAVGKSGETFYSTFGCKCSAGGKFSEGIKGYLICIEGYSYDRYISWV